MKINSGTSQLVLWSVVTGLGWGLVGYPHNFSTIDGWSEVFTRLPLLFLGGLFLGLVSGSLQWFIFPAENLKIWPVVTSAGYGIGGPLGLLLAVAIIIALNRIFGGTLFAAGSNEILYYPGIFQMGISGLVLAFAQWCYLRKTITRVETVKLALWLLGNTLFWLFGSLMIFLLYASEWAFRYILVGLVIGLGNGLLFKLSMAEYFYEFRKKEVT